MATTSRRRPRSTTPARPRCSSPACRPATPVVQTVAQSSTTTTLVSSANPSSFGQSVDFTATVSAATGTPNGSVTFTVDNTPQTPTPLDNSGKAVLTLSNLGVGSHVIG